MGVKVHTQYGIYLGVSMDKEKPKVKKAKRKVHRFVKVLMSEKDHNLMSDLKPSTRKLFNSRLQVYSNGLVAKIRRGVGI